MDEPIGMPAGETAVIPTAPTAPPVSDVDRRPHNPLDSVTPERPRSHPIAYAALALATLALLLSLLGLRNGDDDGFRQVKVGNTDCVIGQQGDADVLYCRASGIPAP